MAAIALTTAPLLAALLRRALPGLAVLDHALAEGGLYPWLPGAMVGTGDAAALPGAMADLLARFRQAGGARPLAGFDPAQDAALAAGAPEAWGGDAGGLRLLVPGSAGPTPFGLGGWIHEGPGAMVLARDAAPLTTERIMLLLGAGGAVERIDLMLPDGLLSRVLPSLAAAARAIAAEAPGREVGLREVSPRLATLTLFLPDLPSPATILPRAALVLEEDAAQRRVRVLLGVLPAGQTLRIRVRVGGGVKAPPALFQDGTRLPARAEADPRGAMLLETSLRAAAAPGVPTLLGLAGMGQGGAAAMPHVEQVEIAAA